MKVLWIFSLYFVASLFVNSLNTGNMFHVSRFHDGIAHSTLHIMFCFQLSALYTWYTYTLYTLVN